MPLSTTLVAHQANLYYVVYSIPSSLRTDKEDPYSLPSLAVASSHSHDYFDDIFPLNEAILEDLLGVEFI